jgi:phosphohistidine phosphatase
MILYVMRHGPAEDRAPSGRDGDRALTTAGREVVARSARALHEARGAQGRLRILASPLRRARETAEIVASHVTSATGIELDDDLAADAGLPHGLVARLAEAGADALLVGHQPNVEALVVDLLHPPPPPPPGGFRTALIVAVERVAEGRWRHAAVLDPYRS